MMWGKEPFHVAVQMVETVGSNLCPASCLGENKGPLHDDLSVERERFRRPSGGHVSRAECCVDIGF